MAGSPWPWTSTRTPPGRSVLKRRWSPVTGHAQRSASQVDTYTYYVVQFFFRNSFRQPMACTVSGGWRLEAGSCLVRDAPRRAGGLACGMHMPAGVSVRCAMCDVRCARGRARKGLGEHGRDQLTRGVRCGAKLAARVQPFWGSRDATRGRRMQRRSDHRQRGAYTPRRIGIRDLGTRARARMDRRGGGVLEYREWLTTYIELETTCRALLRGQSSDPWRLERGRWRAPGR